MIDPVTMIRRRVREFVNTELFGVVPWETVKFDPPEETPRTIGRGGRADGRWRERAVCRFFGIELTVSSPHDVELRPDVRGVMAPTNPYPMGHISVRMPDGVSIEGPMAPETWEKAGACIREHFHEERVNGY